MTAVVQRIRRAQLNADGIDVCGTKMGLMVLVGVYDDDTDQDAVLLAKKVAALRVFSDSDGKMNLSVADVGGEILSVSNFTLCADTKRGNRPSFSNAKEPNEAKRMYDLFSDELVKNGISVVKKGVFGADMHIELMLDGPVTILLDTKVWR